jgi:hypothetical protein
MVPSTQSHIGIGVAIPSQPLPSASHHSGVLFLVCLGRRESSCFWRASHFGMGYFYGKGIGTLGNNRDKKPCLYSWLREYSPGRYHANFWPKYFHEVVEHSLVFELIECAGAIYHTSTRAERPKSRYDQLSLKVGKGFYLSGVPVFYYPAVFVGYTLTTTWSVE